MPGYSTVMEIYDIVRIIVLFLPAYYFGDAFANLSNLM